MHGLQKYGNFPSLHGLPAPENCPTGWRQRENFLYNYVWGEPHHLNNYMNLYTT
jgi:hypothetical protein